MFNGNNPNDFNNMSSQPQNERERLEIDSTGQTYGEKTSKKRQEQKEKFDKNQRGSGRFSDRGRSQGSLLGAIIGIVLILGIALYLPYGYVTGTLPAPLRSIFASPTENKDSLLNSILKMDKTVTELDKDKEERNETSFYDRNFLFQDQFIGTQVEPEYLVYVYTEDDEMNKPFIDWITHYESDAESEDYPLGKYKIYRIKSDMVGLDHEVSWYFNNKPMMLIYNTPEKGVKELDSVVEDPTMLDDIPHYMDVMVEEANANWEVDK